ncbi:hypothetical protein [Microcoleus sp. B4-C1]
MNSELGFTIAMLTDLILRTSPTANFWRLFWFCDCRGAIAPPPIM